MTRPTADGSRAIRVSGETWARLQALATPFRGSELGTPDRVIAHLLDEHEHEHEPTELNLEPGTVDDEHELEPGGHGPEHFNAQNGDIEPPPELEAAGEHGKVDILSVDEVGRRFLLHDLTRFVKATGADTHLTIHELAADLIDAEPVIETLADSPVDEVWGYEFDHPDADRPPGTSGSQGEA